jgi:mono/diheme cytochrome c family protein
MTTLIFVLVWVVLGLGLLLIAFSGGPSGALQQLMSQSRGARKAAIVLFSLLALALGVLVPAAVIAAVSNQDDIPEANVTSLTESEKNGRELFGRRCANCHTLKAANAIASVGPNLDQLRPNKALVLDAIENGRARGNGQMAAGLYTGQDAEDVANFVAKAVGQTESGGGDGEGGGSGGGGGEGGGSGGGGGEGEGEGGGESESGGGESGSESSSG